MSAWASYGNVVGLVCAALLMLALLWAATERGRVHGEWVRRQREPGRTVAQSVDWCMAMAAAAGWA
jgi:hypothetical protein